MAGDAMVPQPAPGMPTVPGPYPPQPGPYGPPQQVALTGPALAKRTYSSPLSYVGITRRVSAWLRRPGRNVALAISAWVSAILFLVFMYVFLVAWYLVIFVLFGFFTFPYRLIRRSHRKREHLAQAQLATMQALLQQQQNQQR